MTRSALSFSLILTALAPVTASASVLSPETQVLTPVSTARQFAGASVAIDGDLALIGVPGATNGASGLVVAYRRMDGVWMIVEQLRHPEAGATVAFTANFGAAVAIDGERAVIGAPNHGTGPTAGQGAAFVYDWDGDSWVLDASALVRPDDTPPRFGASVAISGDRIAVGAPGTMDGVIPGAVVTFETPTADGVTVPSVSTAEAGDDLFGASIDLSGTSLVIGAPGFDAPEIDAGIAYAFELEGGVWARRDSLFFEVPPGSSIGTSVSVSEDRLTFAMGAPRHGEGADENTGGVFIARRTSTTASFTTHTLVVSEESAPSTYFGTSVALDGARLLVGMPLFGEAPRTVGRAYLLELRDDEWVPTARFSLAEDTPIANQARLGDAVALSGDTALVAAPSNDPMGTSRVGLVGVFLVPARSGESCNLDARCESGSCGDAMRCCEMDCGPCGTCDESGVCMSVSEGTSCAAECGMGMCSAGECVALCDAGAMSDVNLVRIRVSGCACRIAQQGDARGLLVLLAVLAAIAARRRTKS